MRNDLRVCGIFMEFFFEKVRWLSAVSLREIGIEPTTDGLTPDGSLQNVPPQMHRTGVGLDQERRIPMLLNFMTHKPYLFTLLLLAQGVLSAGLEIHHLGGEYSRDAERTPPHLFFKPSHPTGGNTSIRNEPDAALEWKKGDEKDANGWGYYQRNRDLGQVFNLRVGEKIQLDGVVLRTGAGTNAVLKGAPGSRVFIQFFEVLGTPSINDNGTPFGTAAKHGWDMNFAKADDYLTGVTYKSLHVAEGGVIPTTLQATAGEGKQVGHLQYLRWDLIGQDEIVLDGGSKGRRFAFMVGFSEPAADRAIGFLNRWWMDNEPVGSVPKLRADPNGSDWWCIRREGNGKLPPTVLNGGTYSPPKEPVGEERAEMVDESLFPEGKVRFELSPVTDGYPDVCTYRTYEFYVEIKP